ncbi:hypothetical protein MPTK1_6g03870 [Marchantia polymorpha subsp. ruderalis]|nr:hypothetical protein MARPO_0034s0131 [Marchantia polymorpha]BBN13482.1 hypothetical protein Mp_6g03870 [Marchantia polymorpha subsp. ruderalis]PTQ41557.1 hypothetical protein MARPO_0034s0131 [Marchantia polymorpha]PTQ41558.1 hypothetical protein MARPO_0034s0131 [Marchantia polymorpha]BBN13483.1 hypothetical protein Mp_6g03870 [Marchantia polymorpha subsp. ruderalis]|eukprot:PTQ41556.1 hypothetical protein MARPO_0034s0131 [Marchantia polymorpha]
MSTVVGSAVPHPEEDIWICKECNWTYPNHHPSAKHRRNHKKVCPGKVAAAAPAPGGSSDDDSGDEAHPSPAEATKHELVNGSVSREFDLGSLAKAPTSPTSVIETPVEITPAVVKDALPTKQVEDDNHSSKTAPTPATPAVGSAVPHPDEDIWICKECKWTYPNHHPSAKHRRNHKKVCPGKVAAAAPAPGGSSDDDSGDEKHPSPAEATTHESAKGLVSREFDIGSLAKDPLPSEAKGEPVEKVVETPRAEVPVQESKISPSAVIETPVSAPVTPAPESKKVEKEETQTSKPSAALASLKVGSAVPHPDDDIWICKECKWTYPNHHPSAKHRRNHKKVCPGKVAAAAPAPGGSSDDDSGDENHPAPAEATKHELVKGSVSREFDLGSLAKEPTPSETKSEPVESVAEIPKAEVPAQESKVSPSAVIETPVEITPDVTEVNKALSEAPDVKSEKETSASVTPAPESKKVEKEETQISKPSAAPAKPTVSSAAPHPEDDIWICKECKWTYPNHHPSAKHRRNHKKVCPGKTAAAAPAPGGSSDDDSGDEQHSSRGEAINPAANGSVSREFDLGSLAKEPVSVEAKSDSSEKGLEPPRVEASAEDTASVGTIPPVSKDEKPTEAAVEVKTEKETGASVTLDVASKKVDKEEPQNLKTSAAPATPAVGSAVPHPEDDIWICKECKWTYPNHHPSAKHRRNHKKVCPGKVAAAAPAPGGSSDDDSGDEKNPSPVEVTKHELVNGSVSREFDLGSLVKEAVPSEAKGEIPAQVGEDPKAEACAQESKVSPSVVVENPVETTPIVAKNDKPVESAAKVEHEEDTSASGTPAPEAKMVEKEPQKSEPIVAASAPTAAGSAVPHDDGDTWRCRECDWTYPNAHPSAKHRRNHKKNCAGKLKVAATAPAHVGSSDEDSDHESHSSPPPPAKEQTAAVEATEPVASVSRDFHLPTAEPTKETKVEEPKVEAPVASHPGPEEAKDVAAVLESPSAVPALPPKVVSSATPHPEDPNDIWICKECKWTYPNAHPSAKHRRNHKKHCPGKAAGASRAPGGSSDEDSDDAASATGKTPSAALENAPVETPVVREREFMPLLGAHSRDKVVEVVEVEAPKVDPPVQSEPSAKESVGTTAERSSKPEAGEQGELKTVPAGVPKAPHDPTDIWVCQQCGWTYPNAHPSAKHRRNHKKVCKKGPKIQKVSSKGGSSSDASSDDEVGALGMKKCFPCLS